MTTVINEISGHILTPQGFVRGTLRVKHVYWIVPYSREYARNAVQQVAQEHGDRTLDLRDYSGLIARDRVHPTGIGYQTIAARLGGEGAPDYQISTQFELQPAIVSVEPDSAGAMLAGRARTEPAWMREPWARRAIARQALAREAWSRTLPRHGAGWPQVQRPIQVMARTTAPVPAHGDPHALHVSTVPTPPIPPIVGRIENGHLTVYRTFRDWKAAHKS